MKGLGSFIRKEFYHIFRDRRTLLILFVMPVALVVLFGFAITTEIKDARIAVLDNAHDELSTELVDKLASSGYFIVDKRLQSNDQLQGVFGDGRIKLVLVFPSDFSKDFYQAGKAQFQIIADGSDLNTSTQLIGYVNTIATDYAHQLAGANAPPTLFETTVKMMYNPQQQTVYMFVPGILALVLAIVSAMMTAVSIAREKEMGTMRVLAVSPLSVWVIIVGKVAPYLIISFIDTMFILMLSVWVFGMPIHGSVALLLVICLIFLFTSLSMGMLISAFVETQQMAAIISIVGLFMPVALLSGFIYPIENMPVVLQWVCQLFPARWFIEAVRDVMLKGVGFTQVWFDMLMMVGMTAFYVWVTIRRFNKRLI